MEPAVPPKIGKRLWHILRVVYYMLRKGINKQKLLMDLQLLFQRGKIAGKALVELMTFHHHHHHHQGSAPSSGGAHHSSFSCRSMDPNMSYYEPRAVEFSCSNTPAYPTTATKRKNRHQRHHGQYKYDADAAAIAKAFEILNSDITDGEPVMASPSPAVVQVMGKSPRVVRPLRITDSPFPIKEEEGVADGRIDKEAEEFIRRFYEKLRLQQLIPPTPEYSYRRAPLVGRA